MIKDLGFIAPFDTFGETEAPDDPLAQLVMQNMNNTELENLGWIYTTFPSQTFKDNYGAALLEYAQGTKSWDEVKDLVVEDWAAEKAALQQ